jgi:hypothetical protein
MKTLPCHKLTSDSMIIQPKALPSCKASICITTRSTEVSHITQRMNSGFSGTLSQINPISNITPYAK